MNICIVLFKPPEQKQALVFLNIIRGLIHGFRDLGHTVSFKQNRMMPHALNIVLGYTMLRYSDHLKRYRYVIYQLEQFETIPSWFNDNHRRIFQHAEAIFDYSPHNRSVLSDMGFTTIKPLPIAYHPVWTQVKQRREIDKDIDVLFFGLMNARRREVLNRLSLSCNVVALSDCYGKARNPYLARARIVLNIHFYPQQHILEMPRIMLALANRSFVVSETSLNHSLGSAMAEAPFSELPDTCLRLLSKPHLRKKTALKAFQLIKQHTITEVLRREPLFTRA